MARASLARSFMAWVHELQQLHRTMAPAGVIIPFGRDVGVIHMCLSKPEWVLQRERTCRGLRACRDGSPSLSKWTVRGFALRVECTGPR